ncbi:glycosyltransferase family 4 protein [Rhizobium sp. XQZ8]|uniref:glycosyltransferase family 4 protein n=1 Tax=Rhizobium populisoli TaxID=2859785 RepID=UPI001C67F3EE|nr:glycosyltransferase family 4 protein [Rhizobium populisoli]MBW6426037.1 glycosyltransferase family 4 protein [Rhizobium populisoli]
MVEKRILALFLSFGGSLKKWQGEGILERELLYIEEYISLGVCDEVLVFTYGRTDQHVLARAFRSGHLADKVKLLPPPASSILGRKLMYSIFGPILHQGSLRRASVYKSNQISGSWSALIAKLTTPRRLVIRLGYVLSKRHFMNGKRLAGSIARLLELAVFRASDAVIVTSNSAEAYVRKVSKTSANVRLIPTYVDTNLFRRRDIYKFDSALLYVGRLTPQKNLKALIAAVAKANFTLHIVGDGDSRGELETVAADAGAKVEFFGSRDNQEVADMMGHYTYFVLPSLHEGLPKVLIESMCAGMICIGTNIPGINDLIEDGVTGYLSDDVSSDSIARAIHRARGDQASEIGTRARQLIVERSGVGAYIESEKIVLFPQLSDFAR